MFYRLTSAISGIGLLLVLGCSTTMVGPNDTPDAEWGYVLLSVTEDNMEAALRLSGESGLAIRFKPAKGQTLRLVRVKPGIYRPKSIELYIYTDSVEGEGVMNLEDFGMDQEFNAAAGEIVYIGDWKIEGNSAGTQAYFDEVRNLSSEAFEEMEMLFPAFASLPRRVGFTGD